MKYESLQDNRFYTEMSMELGGMVKIGKPHEKRNTKYARLSKLNYNNYKFLWNSDLYHEIKRILFTLDLPIQLLPKIEYHTKQFYKKIEKWKKFRNIELIVPIALYITCLQDFVFINIVELYNVSKANRKDFREGLNLFYKTFPEIQRAFIDDTFRIKTILSQLMGLKLHFDFPKQFLSISSQILKNHYYSLKNTKITVITARVFKLTKELMKSDMKRIPTRDICNYLGVALSVCCNIKM